jgi:hypothetical protein
MMPGQWKDTNKLKTGNDMHRFQAVENSSQEERQWWMSIEPSAAISWHISNETAVTFFICGRSQEQSVASELVAGMFRMLA